MRLIPDSALAALVVWQETEGEPYEGKLGVAEAIRNRMQRKFFSDGTVAGTIALRGQFSAFTDDKQDNARLIASLKLDDSDPIVQDCIKAWNEAMTGSNTVVGAVQYYNPAVVTPYWLIDFKEVARKGHHIFMVRK